MRGQQGFTLMELLLAITASVGVVAVAMGIYRQVSKDEIRVDETRQTQLKITLVLDTLKRMGENRTRPFLIRDNEVFFSTTADILGYGRELVRLSGDGDTLRITIIPEIFMPEDWKDKPLLSFARKGENAASWFYTETIPFFHPSFHYLPPELLQRLNVQDEHKPDYLKIILQNDDGKKWIIVF